MIINKINFSYLKNKEVIEDEEKIIFANNIQNKIALIKNDLSFYYEFSGFKLIKCINTNKAIKELLFKNNVESFIKINDSYLKQKDILIISPFTKIKDILNSKTNGNIHNFLKEKNLMNTNKSIEDFILEKLSQCDEEVKNVIDYDLSKCDLINYIDIKDEFVSSENIFDILNILKTYDRKYLVIFNDIDYLKYERIVEFLPFFNFLYFVNSIDEDYKKLENYEEFLIEYDYL